ncbi:MAG TPA: SWIM zinc finger family protein, partial [Gemmata sp.]|nr:SWIM zinc finger family protein [Gemmata sp.]
AIDAARCTCPVGTEGKCKHAAAILLAYIEHPKRFVLVESIDANLGSRSREEMVALVKLFLRESPELEPLLVRPLPGFAMKPPSSSDYYFQALDAIRATNAHDDWAPHEIAAGLADVVKYAHEFGKPGEPLLEVYVAIAQALREELGAAQAAEVTAELPATIREHLHGGEPGADEIVP